MTAPHAATGDDIVAPVADTRRELLAAYQAYTANIVRTLRADGQIGFALHVEEVAARTHARLSAGVCAHGHP